jgi:hypothetical protein
MYVDNNPQKPFFRAFRKKRTTVISKSALPEENGKGLCKILFSEQAKTFTDRIRLNKQIYGWVLIHIDE